MSKLFLATSMLLVGCVSNPGVSIVTPDGTKTKFTTGYNLMAEVDEQVSEVEAPGGYHIRHMVKRQDATRVPIVIAQTAGILGTSYIGYLNNLAEQVTERFAAGQITLQQKNSALAAIEQAKIAAGVTTSTTLNPNFIPK